MIIGFLLSLLARHFWSMLFSGAATTLFFCSDRGVMARGYVRSGVSPIWIFVVIGVAALLMVAQSMGNGDLRAGLVAMWTWIKTSIQDFNDRAETRKTKATAKRKAAG